MTEAEILKIYDRVIGFGGLPPLPPGWFVVQLDSGHYMATNGETESAITVSRFDARKWAQRLSGQTVAPPRRVYIPLRKLSEVR